MSVYTYAGAGSTVSFDEAAGTITFKHTHWRQPRKKRAASPWTVPVGAVEGVSWREGTATKPAEMRLILGDLDDATVFVGPELTFVAADAEALSEMGSTSQRNCRADEALLFAAVATGAAVLRMDERLTPADGIAALLRY